MASIAPLKLFPLPTTLLGTLANLASEALALDDIGVPLLDTTSVTAKDDGKSADRLLCPRPVYSQGEPHLERLACRDGAVGGVVTRA